MKELIELFNEIFPGRKFLSSSDFIEDGLIDSFDLMQIISKLETYYEINIDIDQIEEENFNSFESIEKLIKLNGG